MNTHHVYCPSQSLGKTFFFLFFFFFFFYFSFNFNENILFSLIISNLSYLFFYVSVFFSEIFTQAKISLMATNWSDI